MWPILAVWHGEQLATATTSMLSLMRDLGTEAKNAEEARKLVHLHARRTGPIVGDVRFTPAGFTTNLTSL